MGKYRKVTTKDDLQEGAILLDKRGNRRRILNVSQDRVWLSHKNSNKVGYMWLIETLLKKGDRIQNDK